MKKFILALPLWLMALVLVFFVVANRHAVIVDLYPLSFSAEIPLYLVFFIGLFFGLLLSGFILLLRRVSAATDIYLAKRENARLKSKVVDMENAMDNNENIAPTKTPLKAQIQKK